MVRVRPPTAFFSGTSKRYGTNHQPIASIKGRASLAPGGREVRWTFIVRYVVPTRAHHSHGLPYLTSNPLSFPSPPGPSIPLPCSCSHTRLFETDLLANPINSYGGVDRWQLEETQPGGIRSGGVSGLWSQCDHMADCQIGPFRYYPMDLCELVP